MLCGAAGALVCPRAMRAQAWPTRPLKITIPTAPGGSPDLVARLIGAKLGERLGQPVIVESMTQGVGLAANQLVARSAPDGHTLAMLTGGFTTQAAVVKALPFDPIRDFAFVTGLVAYPMLLLVAPDSAVTNFRELIDRARAEPGKKTYGIIGGGSVYHLLGKWIENSAGVSMVAVPYRGSVAAFGDVIGGRLDAMIDTATSGIPRVRNGQLRALALSAPERYALLPQVPTMAETLPDITLMSWLALAAPARTPAAIIERLNGEVRRALALGDVKEWLAESGVLAAASSSQELELRVRTEIALYSKIVEANGIRPE
jgi:tripartite-type tricarboxylate transporter receptor subunit TctC